MHTRLFVFICSQIFAKTFYFWKRHSNTWNCEQNVKLQQIKKTHTHTKQRTKEQVTVRMNEWSTYKPINFNRNQTFRKSAWFNLNDRIKNTFTAVEYTFISYKTSLNVNSLNGTRAEWNDSKINKNKNRILYNGTLFRKEIENERESG